MTAPSQLRLLRWGVPVVAAAAVAAVVSGVFTAQADPSLPPKTAGQLLVALQGAQVDGLSGTVVQDSNLGLPQLPQLGSGSGGTSSLTSLLTGSHTLRVWYAGQDKQRVALLGLLGETDVVRNGTDAWLWASDSNSATHYKIPAGRAGKAEADKLPAGVTPQQAADAALTALDPTTEVSTSSTTSVAGRSAYELVLAPKDTRALVGQVRLAIDSKTSVPLRVQVFGRNSGNGPAFSVGFSSVSFDVPAAAQFTFNPPPGAKVTQGSLPSGQHPSAGEAKQARDSVKTVGTGWTTVAVLPAAGAADTGQSTGRDSGSLGTFLGTLPEVSGSWGSGRLLSSTLVSALLTDDGRLVVGMVPPDLLYAAAAK
jgi:outer membrane lipoprotein-sorting protein